MPINMSLSAARRHCRRRIECGGVSHPSSRACGRDEVVAKTERPLPLPAARAAETGSRMRPWSWQSFQPPARHRRDRFLSVVAALVILPAARAAKVVRMATLADLNPLPAAHGSVPATLPRHSSRSPSKTVGRLTIRHPALRLGWRCPVGRMHRNRFSRARRQRPEGSLR